MSNNILVTGCKGQLGSEFVNLETNYPEFNFFFKDLDLDVSNKKKLEKFINTQKINIILNAAAYTNVNNAEIERKKANLINSLAVKNLVKLSEIYNLKLIHFSTDYVYSGLDNMPIKENSPTNPLNYYGVSKRNGELFIEKSISESIIIRTSWLYSCFGNNFVNTIIQKAQKENTIDIVNDQYGCPTNARDLATDTMNIIQSKLKLDFDGKVYNYSNLGSTNWNNFGKKIMEYLKYDCKINEVSSRDFKSSIKRPKYSITCEDKIISNFKLNIPYWEESLKNYLINIKL